MPRLPLILVWCLFALASGGCGNGGSQESKPMPAFSSTDPTASATATATAASKPSVAEDQQAAEKALLVLADFPSEWIEKDAVTPPTRSPCPAFRTARSQTTARVFSPDFEIAEQSKAEHGIWVFTDTAAARDAIAGLAEEATRRCVADEASKAATKQTGNTAGPAETARLNVAPLGEASHGFRVTLPIKANGIDVSLTADFVMTQSGRALSFLSLTQIFTTPDEELRNDLAEVAARRLKSALDNGP